MPLEPPVEAVGAIEDYYRRLSARVGLTLEPPELILTFAGDSLLSRERMDDAITLFEFQLRLYPGSLNALWRLGETCRQLGRLEQARDFYRRFLAIQPDDAAMIRQRLAEVEREIQRIKKGPQE